MCFYNGSRITVSVILALTIIVSGFGFSSIISDFKSYSINHICDYYIQFQNTTGMSEAEKQEIADMPYIGEVNGTKTENVRLLQDNVDDFFRVMMNYTLSLNKPIATTKQLIELTTKGKPNTEYEESKKELKTDKEYINVNFIAEEQSFFNKIEKSKTEGEINYSKLKTGEEVIVAAPKKLELTGFADGNSSGYATNADENIGKTLGGYESILIAETPFKVGDKITFELDDKTIKTAWSAQSSDQAVTTSKAKATSTQM